MSGHSVPALVSLLKCTFDWSMLNSGRSNCPLASELINHSHVIVINVESSAQQLVAQ